MRIKHHRHCKWRLERLTLPQAQTSKPSTTIGATDGTTATRYIRGTS